MMVVRRYYANDEGLAYLDHTGCVKETETAKVFIIKGKEVSIPKSKLEDEGEDLIAIPQGYARRRKLRSDW